MRNNIKIYMAFHSDFRFKILYGFFTLKVLYGFVTQQSSHIDLQYQLTNH